MTQAIPAHYEAAQAKVASGRWRVDAEEGLVYGVKGRPFRRTNTDGYIQIKFRAAEDYRREHAVLAHRVIWETVHGPLAPSMTINHRNGDKQDNRMVNLEALTQSGNCRHAWATGLNTALRGADHPLAVLTEDDVRAIYRRAWDGEDQTAIGADFGVQRSIVSNIKNGWAWSHVTDHCRDGGGG